MKRNVLIAILLIGAIGGFAYQVFSKPRRVTTEAKGAVLVMPGVFQISGNITQINLKNSTLTIFNETSGWPIFVIDRKTILSKKGKDIQFANIKSGDFVSVTYEIINGRNIAKSVTFVLPTVHAKSR